jgi:hypothetical protein
MLEASMVASTTERVRSSSSRASVPLNRAKRPRTFDTTMWRIEKLMPEWVVSMFQLVVMVFLLFRGAVAPVVDDQGVRPFRQWD